MRNKYSDPRIKRLLTRREFLKLALLGPGIVACNRTDIPSISSIMWQEPDTPHPSKSPSKVITPSSPPNSDPLNPMETERLTTANTATPKPLNQPLYTIDGHQDIAWNALEFDRDPLLSAFSIRESEAGFGFTSTVGQRTTGLPEWIAGRIGIIFATIFVMPKRLAYIGWNKMTYSKPQEANSHAWEQMDYYHQLIKKEPKLQLIASLSDLETVVDGWQNRLPSESARVGLVLLMEGADPILSPNELPDWFRSGLRIVGPSWAATQYAGGTGEPGSLTDLGKQLLTSMGKLNMILDLSHMSEVAYYEAVDSYPGLIIASHSNPRRYLPTDRGLSDGMIRQLAKRDGVMGIMLYNPYIKPGWVTGHPRDSVTIDSVAEVIDYVVQLTGSIDHVAIGSDFDGGFGLDSIPYGMESVSDLSDIVIALEKRGYKTDEIGAVMNGNWLRILRHGLPNEKLV